MSLVHSQDASNDMLILNAPDAVELKVSCSKVDVATMETKFSRKRRCLTLLLNLLTWFRIFFSDNRRRQKCLTVGKREMRIHIRSCPSHTKGHVFLVAYLAYLLTLHLCCRLSCCFWTYGCHLYLRNGSILNICFGCSFTSKGKSQGSQKKKTRHFHFFRSFLMIQKI